MKWYYQSDRCTQCPNPATSNAGINAYWRYLDNDSGSLHITPLYLDNAWRVVHYKNPPNVAPYDLSHGTHKDYPTFDEAWSAAQLILKDENAEAENEAWELNYRKRRK